MEVERQLFAGLKFDRKRFGKDIARFETRPAGQSGATGSLGGNGTQGMALPAREPQGNLGDGEGEEEEEKEEREGEGEEGEGEGEGKGIDLGLGPRGEGEGRKRGRAGEENVRRAKKGKGKGINEVERVALLRKELRIHVSSKTAPAPLQGFQDLVTRYGCPQALLDTLSSLGLSHPTAIQSQAMPLLLEGQECFACAPTGSGKTLAYALPILQALKKPSKGAIRALVLSPTRELATQIVREFKRFSPVYRLRVRQLTKAAARCNDLLSAPGCDVLVATPLRLAALLGESPKINLSSVEHLVLDEADKLFEMGFLEQIDSVMAACVNPGIVRSLFSATLPETVEQLARTILLDPCRVVVGERNAASHSVKQELLFVGAEDGKLLAMRQLLKQGLQPPVLVFVRSKERAQQLYKELVASPGMSERVGVIHADRTQSQRDTVVENFRSGKVWVLIATDLLGRGMDFKGVNLVINFDFPPTSASYIHRVGRTGRAGRAGRAITLYTEDDKDSLRSVAHLIAASGTEVPAWMLALPKLRKNRKRTRSVEEKPTTDSPEEES